MSYYDPDAATEELEAKLENAKAGWDSALRIVNSSNEVIKKLGAERDAAVAAVERVRAIHTRGETRPGEYFCTYPACESYWPCPTVAALDGAPEPEVKP